MANYVREKERWDAMEQQLQVVQKAKEIKMQKYQIGKKSDHGGGYNPINGQYDTS